MKSIDPKISIDKLTNLFGKTRQGYYYKKRHNNMIEIDSDKVVKLVKTERKLMPKLGTVKLYHNLKNEFILNDIKIGRDRLHSVLTNTNLLVSRRKRFAKTTNSQHKYKRYKNKIKDLVINRANQVWVSDITYITVGTGFAYLSLITDAYTKKIVGNHLGTTLESYHTDQALKMALKSFTGKEKLIHHSDRGIQYCSNNYVKMLEKNEIEISMTETSSPYDNAVAERVNGILKSEFGLGEKISTFENAIKLVRQSITIYNNKRPHMSCGMLTPAIAHSSNIVLNKLWKKYPYKIKDLASLSTS